MHKKLLISLLVILTINKISFAESLSEFSKIYLLTYLPGEELYAVFGHSALRVRDPINDIDVVYNYGTFNFSTPFFYLKFIEGNLEYQLSKTAYATAIMQMKKENRAVLEQRLSLTFEEKNKLYEQLETDFQPENRFYKYRFFKNNCSTKIRDIIESSVDAPIKYESTRNKLSYRQLVHKYVEERPWLMLGIDLMLGREADRATNSFETMFLPDYLTYHFALATVKRQEGIHSLATRPNQILEKKEVNRFQMVRPSVFFIILLILLLVLAPRFYPGKSNARVLDWILYGSTSIYAIVLIYVTTFTNHPELNNNINLVWSVPAVLLLFMQFTRININVNLLPYIYVIYSFLILGAMVGNRWIPQQIPVALYPFFILLIIHSGLKAAKLV